MEIIEDGLEVALDDFLARRLFCFFAQRSGEGPRLSPLWFLWENGAVWNVAQLDGRSYPERVREYPESALAVVDLEPATGRVEHVGMRGEATLESYDRRRAGRLFAKHLGDDRGGSTLAERRCQDRSRSTSATTARRGRRCSAGSTPTSTGSSGSTRRRSWRGTSRTRCRAAADRVRRRRRL